MATATRVLNGAVDSETVRIEVRELDHEGNGVGEPLTWPADALRRPRISFQVTREQARELLDRFCAGQRAPIYELAVSGVIGYEMPPIGSLGWTAGKA